jgi:hypothetical protein
LKRYYPPIIDNDTWNKLRAKRAENKKRKGGGGACKSEYVGNLFRNRCRCVECGGPVIATHGYYTCRNRQVDQCDSKYSLKVAELELSFFVEALGTYPQLLLNKQSTSHNKQVSSIRAQIADIDSQLNDAAALLGKVKVEALEKKLVQLTKAKQTLSNELEQLNVQRLSTANAPIALDDIKTLLNEFKNEPDTKTKKFDDAMRQLTEALKDNELRKRLLVTLPSIVQRIEFDTTNGHYRIVNLSEEKSEWIKLVL